jgi:phospholipid/cholesterol/gamma-HCH transport system substrate-binding protein
MRLDRRVKVQLAAFAVIAVTAITVLAFGYARVDALLFGVGRYRVTIELPVSAGLYDRANVTFRGAEVGRVTSVSLTDTGVQAALSLDRRYAIPADVSAEVHSQSAVGEQFVALVPRGVSAASLRDGDTIHAERATTPPDINDLLNKTNSSLQAIPNDDLKILIDESYLAFGGLGPDLARIVDAGTSLAVGAKQNLRELTDVVDYSPALLHSQINTSDAVTAWAAHLAVVTQQLHEHNDAVSGVLKNTGPATDQADALVHKLRPTLPVVLANLVGLDEVAIVFQPNLEQVLVLLPQNLAQIEATGVGNKGVKGARGGNQEFATNLNVPPPCLTGYLPPNQWRSPVLVDSPPRPPGDFYCRIPQNADNDVRGARNIPCETKPWKRAPTVWMCESDENYVPLNEGNYWKGDPNATLSGQGVPQFPGTAKPPIPGAPQGAAPSPDGRPPPTTPPAALGFSDYNPANGTYIGSDGQVYTQSNLAHNAKTPTLRSMMLPPVPPAG